MVRSQGLQAPRVLRIFVCLLTSSQIRLLVEPGGAGRGRGGASARVSCELVTSPPPHVLTPDARKSDKFVAHIEFVPTVPHCHLATLIGLCIR